MPKKMIRNAQTGESVVREMTQVEIDALKPSAEQLRANASVPRADFLKACVAAGIISEAVAEEAASGAWPTEFNAFLAGLSGDQRIEAKATWADGGNVRRNNPILALIAQAQSVTDEQLDTMFGITGG